MKYFSRLEVGVLEVPQILLKLMIYEQIDGNKLRYYFRLKLHNFLLILIDFRYLSVEMDMTPRAYHGVCALDGLIYMVGGFDGSEHFNTMRSYDPTKGIWSERACMYQVRK